MSALSRGLKLMSKDLRVPLLVLSQLSRARKPGRAITGRMLSDLRESGKDRTGRRYGDVHLPRRSVSADKESLKGIAEILMAKQRNGPTGRVKLAFLNKFTKFENLALDTGDEDAGAPFE